MRAVRVVLSLIACVALGALVGVVGAFQHPTDWTVGGTRWGTGVLLGIAALVLAQVVARRAVPFGLGPAAVLLGWTLTVATLGTSRPEGDLAVPAGVAGEAFLFGGFVVGLVVAGVLAFRDASGARPTGR